MKTKLKELCEYKESDRNKSWEKELFLALEDSEIYLGDSKPFVGPDGFTYSSIKTEGEGEPLNLIDFLEWCCENGLGVVLNLKEDSPPDYVFNFGMIWNFYTKGSFVNEVSEKEASSDEDVHSFNVHEVTEEYLPMQVRTLMNEFLEANKVMGSKISLISVPSNPSEYELIWFFKDYLDVSNKDKESLLEALGWFLPLDYKIAWVDEENKDLQLQTLV